MLVAEVVVELSTSRLSMSAFVMYELVVVALVVVLLFTIWLWTDPPATHTPFTAKQPFEILIPFEKEVVPLPVTARYVVVAAVVVE